MKPFVIAGISFMPRLWKPKRNLKQLIRCMREAAGQGAQVVATPEGILDGYITRDLARNRIRQQDEGTKGYGQRLARFKKRQLELADEIKRDCLPAVREETARLGIHLFVNTLDRRAGRAVYNTTFLIDPEGQVAGTYDKVHSSFEVVNTLGRGYPVFETPYAPIGVVICADRQFPEAPRSVALGGARVLVINSYGMWGEGANERFIRQRAYENGLFVLFSHPNESVLVCPKGRIIAATCAWESVVVRRIDPRESAGRGLFGETAMARTYLTDMRLYARAHREKLARVRRKKGK